MNLNATCSSSNTLPSPMQLFTQLPMTDNSMRTVSKARTAIKNILNRTDNRLLVIAGPCFIHDPDAAIDYAERLNRLRILCQQKMFIIMRVYLEKPRTSLGWKGLINDPHLDNSCDVAEGLRIARKLLLSITEMGLAAGMEFLDPLIVNYIGDLASWAAIGARTAESQIHREMVSGLNMPVGFKNGTDGSIETAINSILAARRSHSFIGIDKKGQICIRRTGGNSFGHLILRGGKAGPNYDSETIDKTERLFMKHNLNPSIIVDCSHMNAGKQFRNQARVWQDCIRQRAEGRKSICGLMLESNINEGKQSISPEPLRYGVSITDECIDWEMTESLFRDGLSF